MGYPAVHDCNFLFKSVLNVLSRYFLTHCSLKLNFSASRSIKSLELVPTYGKRRLGKTLKNYSISIMFKLLLKLMFYFTGHVCALTFSSPLDEYILCISCFENSACLKSKFEWWPTYLPICCLRFNPAFFMFSYFPT